MANQIIPGQNNTKLNVFGHKLTSFIAKRSIWIGAIFIVIGVGIIAYKIFHTTPHEQATTIVKQANQQIDSGKFNDAIQSLLDAYNTEPKLIIKAGIASKIGIKYYQTGNSTQGKKWLQQSASDYRKAGDQESAKTAEDAIAMWEGAQKTTSGSPAVTNHNANNRGNVIDGNL
jgi:hypothetical protein